MRCLVTGSNGLLGQALVAQLAPNNTLAGIGQQTNSQALTSIAYQVCDIRNYDSLAAVIKDFDPEVIVHTAACTDVDWCEQHPQAAYEHNVLAVEHLIRILHPKQHTNKHLVHLSTDFVFDGTTPPYAESAIPNPCNTYGQTKWAAEQLLNNSTVSHSILRTSLVYGYGHALARKNIVLWIVEALQAGEQIHMLNNQWRMPTYVQDLAWACAQVLQQPGIFHIVGQEVLTPYTLALLVAQVFELDPQGIVATQHLNATTAPRPVDTRLNIASAKSRLGYQPTPTHQALAEIRTQQNTR